MDKNEIYVLIDKNKEPFMASLDYEKIVQELLSCSGYLYEPCYIKIYDLETGKFKKKIHGNDIKEEAYKKNVLKLPQISFADLVEKTLDDDDYNSGSICFSMETFGLEKNSFEVEIYENEDGKITEVKMFFSKRDYAEILRNPDYIENLTKNGKCKITIENSFSLYHCQKIQWGEK